MTEETVLTRHPTGKNNFPVDRDSYDLFRDAILSALQTRELTHMELVDEVTRSVSEKFSRNISWHVMTVKLDLEARKIIERTTSKPERYRVR
jgi:hypothetical protein